MAHEKELKIKITGDATQLGAASQKAMASIGQVKASMSDLVGSFTGGFLGGGVVGVLSNLVGAIGSQIANARALANEARNLGLGDTFLRGAKRVGSIVFDQQDLIPSAISAASQKRSDALFGDPAALRALSALGLSAQGISSLTKEELFEAIVRAFREGPDTRDRRVAVADLFGNDQTNKLLPFLIGGKGGQLNFSDLIQKLANDPTVGMHPFSGQAIRSNMDRNFRGEAEPISRAGIGNAKQEDDLKRENDQRALLNARARMTTEERIASIAEERARLEALMKAESDGVTRQKIRTDILQLEAEQGRLANDPVSRARGVSIQGFTSQADEFAQRGLFVGGAGMTAVPQILHVHTQKLERVVTLLEAQYRANEANWGK